MKEFPIGVDVLSVGFVQTEVLFFARFDGQTIFVRNGKHFSDKNRHQTINRYYIV
jgi:hypothetical protein